MLHRFRGWFLEQLGMYAAYHRDRRNRITHHIGVPLIVFSLILALMQVSIGQFGPVAMNAAALVLGVLLLGYVLTVPLVGIIAAAFYGAIYFAAETVAGISPDVLWTTAAACFVAGWIIQFIGHAFEGRRPALTVNAIQIFMAPPFLIAEVLFALGLERSLEARVRERAVKYLPGGPGA